MSVRRQGDLLPADVAAALEQNFESKISRTRRIGGGDINEAVAVEWDDGRTQFVKWNRQAPRGMFTAEARGLAFIDEAGALRVPRVLAASEDPAFLVLEMMVSGPKVQDFDARLGRGLAELHRTGANVYGLDHDNFIGSLPQMNRASPSWAEFYRGARLEPMIERAARRNLLPSAVLTALSTILDRLPALTGPAEPPSRLHGDLWGGNLHVTEDGLPALIDPAVYGGHREMDLAMMRLFGGFGEQVFAAYDESFPLAEGSEARIPLYQLYPLLVHVNLFGSAYVGALSRAADASLRGGTRTA